MGFPEGMFGGERVPQLQIFDVIGTAEAVPLQGSAF